MIAHGSAFQQSLFSQPRYGSFPPVMQSPPYPNAIPRSQVSSIVGSYNGHPAFHWAIPTPEEVNHKLSRWNGLAVGAECGSIIGVVISLPIYGLERYFKSKDLLTVAQQALPKSVGTNIIRKPMMHLGITLASSLVSITLLGGFVGMVLSSSLKNKIKVIAETHQQQQKGEKPKDPNAVQRFYQRLGLLPKPVNNPQAAFDQLVNDQLDGKQAFWEGFKEILIIKLIVGGLMSVGTHLGLLCLIQGINFYKLNDNLSFWQKLKLNNKNLLNLMLWQQTKAFFKHPMALTKLALLPVIGGLVAMQLFPQIRERLISMPRQSTVIFPQ